MNFFETTAITAFVVGAVSVTAAKIALRYVDKDLNNKVIQKRHDYQGVGTLDFEVRGDWFSCVFGLTFLLGYLTVCAWITFQAKEVILALLVALALGFIGFLGLYYSLLPWLRIVRFEGDKIHYRDVFGERFKIHRSRIKSVKIESPFIIIETSGKSYNIRHELQDPVKVYWKLRRWKAQQV
jgi:hypothetical protein